MEFYLVIKDIGREVNGLDVIRWRKSDSKSKILQVLLRMWNAFLYMHIVHINKCIHICTCACTCVCIQGTMRGRDLERLREGSRKSDGRCMSWKPKGELFGERRGSSRETRRTENSNRKIRTGYNEICVEMLKNSLYVNFKNNSK